MDECNWLRMTYFTVMRYEYCRKTLMVMKSDVSNEGALVILVK